MAHTGWTRRRLLATSAGAIGSIGSATVVGQSGLSAAATPASATALPGSYRAPELPGGTESDRGSPITALTIVQSAFGSLPDGRFVLYAPTVGDPAAINVTTATTGQNDSIAATSLPRTSGAPGLALAAGGRAYVGTYFPGRLFVWDPSTHSVTDLGEPVPGQRTVYCLAVAPDGTVYGGTHPGAQLFSYHPDRGFTVLTEGPPASDVTIIRGVTVDPDRGAVYFGTMSTPRLFRFDLASHSLTEIIPERPFTGNNVFDVAYHQGRLFANANRTFRVFDTTSNRELSVIDAETGSAAVIPIAARGVSPLHNGQVYFGSSLAGGRRPLLRYDLASNTVHRTGVELASMPTGYGWTETEHGPTLFMQVGNYVNEGAWYAPGSNQSGLITFPLRRQPAPLQHLLPSADGKRLYVNAFLNGNSVRVDLPDGSTRPIVKTGQVEDWLVTANDPGVIYAGTYPDGKLLAIRPDQPGSGNLVELAALKPQYAQDRTLDLQESSGRLYGATMPVSGERGGALVVHDLRSNRTQVWRHVVPQHTIASVLPWGDLILAGSSADGGGNLDPDPAPARLIEFDPASGSVTRDVVPFPNARSINALLPTSTDTVLCLADGKLFEFDPDAWALRRSVSIVGGTFPASSGEILQHPNGYIYVSIGNMLFVVDPFTFKFSQLATTPSMRLVQAQGDLYYLIRPAQANSYVHYARFRPNVTTASDVRRTIVVNGVSSGVANRFVAPGETLQDVVVRRLATDRRSSYQKSLVELLSAGQISRDERRRLASLR